MHDVVKLYCPAALVAVVPQEVPSGFLAVTVALPTGPLTAEPVKVVMVPVTTGGVGAVTLGGLVTVVAGGETAGGGTVTGVVVAGGVVTGAVVAGGVVTAGEVVAGGVTIAVTVDGGVLAAGGKAATGVASPPPQAVTTRQAAQTELTTKNLADMDTPISIKQ